MNHYIVRSEGGISRVHFRAESLEKAIKDCFVYDKAATGSVEWHVLSTERDLAVGSVVGGTNS